MTATSQAKQAIREQIWSQLEQAGAVEPGVRGYIPAFEGADQAADRLANLPVWQQAQILEVVPDRAQLPVRIRALQDGKLVYMAAPKLATADPFYLLDPRYRYWRGGCAADEITVTQKRNPRPGWPVPWQPAFACHQRRARPRDRGPDGRRSGALRNLPEKG